MYLSHYGLKEKPFQINPDPRFLWLGDTHKEALATLKYGILESKGFLLLTGDVGTGKTTLINGLLESLDENTIVASVSDPGLERLDFYNFLGYAFKMEKKFGSKGDFVVHFIHYLHKAHEAHKKVLLIIDEAQRIPAEMMEEIRLLSNIEKQDAKLLNIFMVGQDELNKTLADPKNRALLQRITIRYSIGPLKKSEVGDYIEFRLKVAGAQKNIFSSGAIREIISFSKCYPRLINVICDRALLTGFVGGNKTISAKIIKECAKELQAPQAPDKEEKPKGGLQSAWKIPVYSFLIALLLVAAGYFVLPDKYQKTLPGIQTDSQERLIEKTQEKAAKNPEGPPLTTENAGMPQSQPDLLSKNASSGVQTEKPTVTEKAETKFQPDSIAQKETEPDSEKQDATSVEKPLPFPGNKLVINFASNSNEFSDEAYGLLDRFVQKVFEYPDAEIVIKGYTDASGSYSYNKRLSRFRANIVKSYFVGQGIDPSKIKSFGMGPDDPIASNESMEGRSANRRIEIELIPPGATIN